MSGSDERALATVSYLPGVQPPSDPSGTVPARLALGDEPDAAEGERDDGQQVEHVPGHADPGLSYRPGHHARGCEHHGGGDASEECDARPGHADAEPLEARVRRRRVDADRHGRREGEHAGPRHGPGMPGDVGRDVAGGGRRPRECGARDRERHEHSRDREHQGDHRQHAGGRAVGLSKAEALKDELVKLYPGQGDLPIEGKNTSALSRLRRPAFFDGYANLVDMTASNIVFNALRDADLPDALRVHRAEIAHRGKLGLLSIEGVGRNPRIDDLQTLIYDSAIEDDAVAAWLEEVKSTRDDRVGSGGLEDIQVGLSCSSATMRLADEVVSFHAAVATRRLRPYLAKDGPSRTDGVVNLSFLSEEGDSRSAARTINPTIVLGADCGWQIRIAATAAKEMSELMRRHSPSETGGILVGRLAVTRKTIYVTRLVPAPPDSRGTPWVFTRGTEKLPEALDRVGRRTGGLLTYVGEWHTHPMGGSDLSDTDKTAVISLRSILDRVGLPTLVIIVTPDEIQPHLFEPTSPPVVIDPPRRRFGIIRVVFGWRR